jgi:hypothetical protein
MTAGAAFSQRLGVSRMSFNDSSMNADHSDPVPPTPSLKHRNCTPLFSA